MAPGSGLAISRTIVLAHGGKLAYRPAPDGGACFYFTLPAVPEGVGNEGTASYRMHRG